MQLGRPSASGSRGSRWVECRFEVTHNSRSRRKVSEARLDSQLVTMARSISLPSMRSSKSHRRLADHAQLDARIGAREARHDLGQITVGVVVRHAEPHASRQGRVGKRRHRLDVELDQPPRVVEQAQRRPRSAWRRGRRARRSAARCRSSSRFICIDTADCVLFTTSAALVKLPVSAMAMKERTGRCRARRSWHGPSRGRLAGRQPITIPDRLD